MGGGIRDPRLPQYCSNGAVSVEKLAIVVDAGTLIHPDGALAQVEGSALWGLSMALHEGTEFIKGQVRTRTSTATRRCASMTCLISTSNSSTAPRPRSVSASLVRRSSRPPSAMPCLPQPGFGCATFQSGCQPCSGHSRRRNECDVTDVRFSACEPQVENSVTKWRLVGSRMKDVLSLVTFTIVALCPAVFVVAVRPPSADLAAHESPHCIMASSGAPGFDFEWRCSYFTGWRSSRSISELLASSGSTIHRSPRDE
jgi:hypothetical protein